MAGLRVGEAPKASVRAEEQLAVRHRQGGVGRLVHGVGGQKLELRAGAQHEHIARTD